MTLQRSPFVYGPFYTIAAIAYIIMEYASMKSELRGSIFQRPEVESIKDDAAIYVMGFYHSLHTAIRERNIKSVDNGLPDQKFGQQVAKPEITIDSK